MKLPMAEFYITNRCNLDCAYCNRLNNYNFKGHYELDAYRELYTQWSKIIQFQKLSILGGEPLLHKDLLYIVKKLSDLVKKKSDLIKFLLKII